MLSKSFCTFLECAITHTALDGIDSSKALRMFSIRFSDEEAGVRNPTAEAKVSHTRPMVGVSGSLRDGLGKSLDDCLV